MNNDIFQDQVIERLTAIEINLKEHMRRTALAEGKIDSLEKYAHMSLGAISLMTFIAAMGGIYVFFK